MMGPARRGAGPTRLVEANSRGDRRVVTVLDPLTPLTNGKPDLPVAGVIHMPQKHSVVPQAPVDSWPKRPAMTVNLGRAARIMALAAVATSRVNLGRAARIMALAAVATSRVNLGRAARIMALAQSLPHLTHATDGGYGTPLGMSTGHSGCPAAWPARTV
jgi:hypothetical protein